MHTQQWSLRTRWAATRAPATAPRLGRDTVNGQEVPTEEQFLPNSARAYRAGYHEGIDFPAKSGTPVLAAKSGTIARIDTDFKDWTPAEEQAAFDASVALGYTPAATLDRIRGRQVWIDHPQDAAGRVRRDPQRGAQHAEHRRRCPRLR